MNSEERFIDLCLVFNGIFEEYVLFCSLVPSMTKIHPQESFKDIY